MVVEKPAKMGRMLTSMGQNYRFARETYGERGLTGLGVGIDGSFLLWIVFVLEGFNG